MNLIIKNELEGKPLTLELVRSGNLVGLDINGVIVLWFSEDLDSPEQLLIERCSGIDIPGVPVDEAGRIIIENEQD